MAKVERFKVERPVLVAHVAIWILAGLSAYLSRIGSQTEAHLRLPLQESGTSEHLRMLLSGPSTDFKIVSLIGVVAATVLAVAVRPASPRWLRRATPAMALVCLAIYAMGYGTVP